MLTTSKVVGRDTGKRLIELIDKIGDDLGGGCTPRGFSY